MKTLLTILILVVVFNGTIQTVVKPQLMEWKQEFKAWL